MAIHVHEREVRGHVLDEHLRPDAGVVVLTTFCHDPRDVVRKIRPVVTLISTESEMACMSPMQ